MDGHRATEEMARRFCHEIRTNYLRNNVEAKKSIFRRASSDSFTDFEYLFVSHDFPPTFAAIIPITPLGWRKRVSMGGNVEHRKHI